MRTHTHVLRRIDGEDWDRFVARCRAAGITPDQELRAHVRTVGDTGRLDAERPNAEGKQS